MAKFIVTQNTYRAGLLHVPGVDDKGNPNLFVVADEELHQHCDSVALTPADEETKEAILVYAEKSKAAGKILAERENAKKAAVQEAEIAKKSAEVAKKRAAEAAEKAKEAAK